jgi:hypothetical protein
MKTILHDLEIARIRNRLLYLEIRQRMVGVRPRFLSSPLPDHSPRRILRLAAKLCR